MAANNIGFGDAFLVNTPTLDRWSQQLYQEQKIRQVKNNEESKVLDATVQKELGKVRSIDTPEVIKSYQDAKALKMKLLFDKKLQKDPLEYNKTQQLYNQAYQNIFTTANKSAEIKDMTGKLMDIKPDDRSDDFGQRLTTLTNTPLSKLGAHPQYGADLTNIDKFRYAGSNTDFAKILKEAVGQPRKVHSREDVMDGGLQTKITPYEFGNTPGQVKDYLIGAMAVRQAGRDAGYQWDHLPENEIAETIKQYQAIPKEKWERMGLPGPQDLLPKNPDNKAENYASYQAMKYAIANEPKEGTPIFRENKAAVMAAQEARDKRMKAIEKADAKELIQFKKDIDPNDTELNNVWYESHYDKLIQQAKDNKDPDKRHHVFTTKGKSLYYYDLIAPDSYTMEAFKIGNKYPDRMGVTLDNKLVPIFFKYDDKGNKLTTTGKEGGPSVVDEDYSRPYTRDQALVSMGYRGATKKQLREDQQKLQSPSKNKTPSVDVENLRKKYNY